MLGRREGQNLRIRSFPARTAAIVMLPMLVTGVSASDAVHSIDGPDRGVPDDAVPAAIPTRTQTIVVDPAACRWLQRHEPAADLEYKAGVDVRGRAVAPADLLGSSLPGVAASAYADKMEIAITAELAGRLGVPAGEFYKGEAYLGTVTLDRGSVSFNGAPLSPAAESELVALCREQGRRR